jgi:hypothetical protein
MTMKPVLRLLALVICALPLIMSADTGGQIKDAHREAARKFISNFASGLKLSGNVEQNGSQGAFEAYYYGTEWVVREKFGSLESFHANSADGSWSGSNYSLTYKVEPDDSPASAVMDLLGSGAYLEEPYWSSFTYAGEDAGGYKFHFAPAGLPEVTVVLYSDPEAPEHLQLMSTEVAFCASDPDSIVYRSYYYYTADSEGRLYTQRETGREIDQAGETVNFSDYRVTGVEQLEARPAELDFSRQRVPIGEASASVTAPVEVPADTSKGYFIVPMTFPHSDQVFQFMLDTGASVTLMTQAAAAAADLSHDIQTMAHGHGSRAALVLGLCRAAAIGAPGGPQAPLSGFPATQIPETNKDLLGALESYGAAGILGNTVFEQYVVKLDHPGGKITLYPPQLFRPPVKLPDGKFAESDVPIPNIAFDLDCEDLIFCIGKLDDKVKGEVVIDSGLQQDLSLLRETLDANNLKLEKVDERSNTVLGGVKKFQYVKVPSFELGPLRMVNKIASVTDDDSGTYAARGVLGFIGLALFQDGPVWLDVFQQRMYVGPPVKLGYFPGLTPPPGGEKQAEQKEGDGKEQKSAPEDGQKGKTKLPVNIGSASSGARNGSVTAKVVG